jgi:hypothetical protein
MPELIDRYATIDAIPAPTDADEAEYYGKVCDAIEAMPTIEPEVQHGRWILCKDQSGVDNDNNNYAYFCSQCHYQDVHSTNAKVNFCWNCGCKMQDGGADNAE